MKITAAELIAELQKVPGETEVHFQMDDGCCGDYMDLELGYYNIDTYQRGKTVWNSCQIRMQAIDGFTSCIKSGATKKFTKSLYEEKK